MNITVLGAGAMGSFFGGVLSKVGCSVTLLDINKGHIEAINQNGLCLETAEGKHYIRSIKACHSKDSVDIPDLLIVFTKSMQTRGALVSIQHIIGKDTQVLTLQNGLGNLEVLKEFISFKNILIGSTTWPADFIAQGHVASHGMGSIRMMSAEGSLNDITKNIVHVFNDAGLACQVDENVWAAIWEKVAFNCALNSLCAVTGCSVDQLGLMPDGKSLSLKIVDEVLNVAKEGGISVSVNKTHEQVIDAMTHHHGHLPSMLQDIKAGRPTEIEALNGAVVEKAQLLGIKVPYTESLLSLVRLIDTRALHS